MVEVSRDGKRVYLTNSLYAAWDEQFYPDGIDGWLVKLDAGEDGSLTARPGPVRRVQRASARTRCAWRAATRRSTRTASRTAEMHAALALDPARAAGRLSRPQPRDGLAVRGRARHAGARSPARCCARCRPIAIGHEASILVIAVLVLGLGLITDPSALHLGAGVALIAFGLFRFIKPRAHFRWVDARQRRAARAGRMVVPDVDRPRRGADGRAGADRRRRGRQRRARATTRSRPRSSTG